MEAGNKEEFEGIDLDKAISVLRKSWGWIILIFLLTNVSAYLVVRYTKPLFESSSELKLDVETNATELGLTTIGENQNLNIISGEIELIKSKLFFNKVIDDFNLDAFYFTEGDLLDDEKYKTSPFKVDFEVINESIYDKKIRIEIIDSNSFKLSTPEENSNKVYQFGQVINTNNANLIINKTPYFLSNNERYHYFIINSRSALIAYIEDNLSVVPLNLNANTIKISFQDHNASKARDIVNAVDSIYLKYTNEEKNLENKQKINWLNGELASIERQLEGFESYFENFTIDNRTNDLDADLENTINYINRIDSQRYELSKKINNAQGLLTTIESNESDVTLLAGYGFSKEVTAMLNQLTELIAEYESLKLSYTESTFALTRKEKEIQNLRATLKKQVSKLITDYENRTKELEKQKAQLQRNFVELPGKSTEFNKKQRFFKLYEEFYLSLMQNKAEYQIAQAGTTTKFKILSAATLPTKPISPDKLIIHGIGFVAGLVFAFFFVGIRYLLHNKISTPGELERLTDAPILGSIPEEKSKMQQSIIMVDERPKSAISESLRSIRTNIDFMVSKKQQRVISITSTIGGEGKTFTAVNLGAIIAMSKKKVLVLDLDMRKPRVHLSFGDGNPNIGVSTILIGNNTIDECVIKSRIDNLHYINAGPTPPNPSELLLNGEFDDLLNKLKLTYDVIILDTPPVGLVTDGILAMKKADLAMYVVRANYSKRNFLKTLNRLVSVNQFKNIAVILNALPQLRSNNYGYGYGYYDNSNPKSQSVLNKLFKK
ncbi:GumC family protein [Fulvivirga lutea]|uniref:non-specific protein-tyrosine kinase n=1 Tax=Fulvivirga lutea TaxID=2810512 RepID=A0A974WFQ8_9BACT|nr:tyrosine-protein kinase [Fulvivirga lutea]QSE97411.1 polysaccharide biosynthesis tyrosine autokinase [Fulvivirga lutea]